MPDELLATTIIQNSSIETPVEFCLIHENEKSLFTLIGNNKNFLKVFDNSGGFQKYSDIVMAFLKKFINFYGGFPSKETPAEKIIINFQYEAEGGACTSTIDGKKCFVRLGASENALASIERVLYHETLHFVSQKQHDESTLVKQLVEKQTAFLKSLKYNTEYFETNTNSTLSAYTKLAHEKLTQESIDFIMARLLKVPEDFHELFIKKFHNIIADVGLIIISIELGDTTEYEYYQQESKNDLTMLDFYYKYIKQMKNYMKQNPDELLFADMPDTKLTALFNLLLFCTAVNRYPWFIVPYAKLGTKWTHNQPIKPDPKSEKLLSDYKNLALEDESVEERLSRIFAAFESLIDYHRIKNDPYDKDMQHKVHDTGAMELADQALSTLLNEFKEFSKENQIEEFFRIEY